MGFLEKDLVNLLLGHRAATYTLIETAKLHGLDPQSYLRHVFERIADRSVTECANYFTACGYEPG